MFRSTIVRSALFTVLGGLGLASCTLPNQSAGPGAGSHQSDDVGSVSFELTLGGKYHFNSFNYDIAGNGFHKTDSVNVAATSTISAVVDNIPAGTGYQATLTATATEQDLTPCTGSATFDVTAGATVALPVHLTCHVKPTMQPPPPPPAVPVPPAAGYALAALLGVLGVARARRQAS
jgi:hypothetical protein